MEAPPQQQSSPGVRPVELKDCIEELLKFTLISSIQGKVQTDLSNEYCTHLLRDDPSRPLHTDAEVIEGVPSYPLYKQLASSLYRSIILGALDTSNRELIPAHEDLNLRKKDDEWNKMIVEKGSALLSLLKEVNFELHVQEPFFSLLSDGVKTIEGRCAVGDYKRIQAGHVLICNKCLTLQVQDVRQYSSFREMLEAESLASVLPGVTSIEEGSTLTNGARALTKHVLRSSKGYWGALHGSDAEKNRHAVDLISRLLADCSWMNMHIVRPHGTIFEIRNDDGYGARWSVDGTKFIGFLEPYAVDGHSKGWKH